MYHSVLLHAADNGVRDQLSESIERHAPSTAYLPFPIFHDLY